MYDIDKYLFIAMLLVVFGLTLVFITGCSLKEASRMKLYNVDCMKCKVKMKFDIEDKAGEVEVRGF